MMISAGASHREGSATAEPDARLERRFRLTLAWVRAVLPPPARLLDLGPPNTLGERFREVGYEVSFTGAVDLDEKPEVAAEAADAVTAFEVLEHVLNPLGVLQAVTAPRLFASVPLSLWFAPAYRHPTDPWDRHFHEFEDWQFDWLLDKAGWRITRRTKWTNPTPGFPLGVRPWLRRVTPRWYVVEAERLAR